MERLLKEAEVAKILNVSYIFLRAARAKGRTDIPPHVRIGRSVRYVPKDVEEWVKQRQNANG